MDKVDIFAVNSLLESYNPYLTRIGKILYRCDGTLDKDETDEVATILKEYVQRDLDNEYERGWQDGYKLGSHEK